MIDSEARSHYRNEGFLVIRNLINRSDCRDLYHALIRLAHKYNPTIPLSWMDKSPWIDPEVVSALTQLRKDRADCFGAIYDTLQVSQLVQQITASPQVAAVAAELLDDSLSGIAATGHMMRMDVPEDKRNALGWHQEAFYYNQNLAGENGVVAWFPLHDLRPEHGPVVVCPGSHRLGTLSAQSTGKKDYSVSEQFIVPESVISQYQEYSVIINAGDCLFFNFDLLHRSGWNHSNQIRFCAGARFHKMVADDFLPGRTLFKANEKIGRWSDHKAKTGQVSL